MSKRHGGTIRNGSRFNASYRSWENMKERCLNPNSKDYKNYGGRGIVICDEWLTFEGFYNDMGNRPKDTTLGRIDNEGHYCKDNCEFQTAYQQQNNTRKTIHMSDGLTLSSVAEDSVLKRATLETRIWRGYSEEELKSMPLNKKRDSQLKSYEHLVGSRNGRLVVESITREAGRAQVLCKCDCGNIKKVSVSNFSKTNSCGCLRKEHLLSVRITTGRRKINNSA